MKKITIVYSEPIDYFPESVRKEFEKDEKKKIKEKIKMTYEEAKEKALKINPNFNSCKEYKKAYHFYDKRDKTEREPDNDVVILKETGKILNLSTFILDYLPERNPKAKNF